MNSNPYESRRLVDEYLFFHYADLAETTGGLPVPSEAWGFATRVVRELWPGDSSVESALDVGCAVGASSFELARRARRVVGVDFSNAFIDAAREIRSKGWIAAQVAEEGRRMRDFTVSAPEGLERERVDFQVGDATDLPLDIGAFDVVLAANLVCRLPEPKRFLDRLPALVKPGGVLLMATPFSWLEEFTPVENWLGGVPGSEASFELLSRILAPNFELETTKNLPFLIREHSRKFQYGISLGSRWRRR
jgi:putative 4-mercaptohistidine N1-methyltranferase